MKKRAKLRSSSTTTAVKKKSERIQVDDDYIGDWVERRRGFRSLSTMTAVKEKVARIQVDDDCTRDRGEDAAVQTAGDYDSNQGKGDADLKTYQ